MYTPKDSQYDIFNLEKIKTYPIKSRSNKLKIKNLIDPYIIMKKNFNISDKLTKLINNLAEKIVFLRQNNKPVILFTGAHLIKNGFSPLIINLIKKNVFTLIAGNGATAIHDFELAMIGETSENVPQSLGIGQFGMAYELGYINKAITLGHKYSLGLGESLGKMICESAFCLEALSQSKKDISLEFLHSEVSILATCYKKKIPITIHVGIGTDVIDQHPSFDPEAKGGCSGRDFLIFVNNVVKMSQGGAILNIGSAVTGPEVILKAVSMAANTRKAPSKIITADFDIREETPVKNPEVFSQYYYFRDQKSVVARIPETFGGKGYYIQGDQRMTFPFLYKKIIEKI